MGNETELGMPGLSGLEGILTNIDEENKLGISARMQNDISSAELHYFNAFRIICGNIATFRDLGFNYLPLFSDYFTNMGDLKRIEEKVCESEELFSRAIDLAGKDNSRLAKAYEFRGILYQQQMKDYTKAVSDHKKAMELYESLGNKPKVARLKCLIASSFVLQPNREALDEAIINCEDAIDIYDQLTHEGGNFEHDMGDAFHTLGRVHSANKMHKLALHCYAESLQYFNGEISVGARGTVHARMAYEWMNLGNSKLVVYHLAEFEKIRDIKPCLIQKIVLTSLEPMLNNIKDYLTAN